MPEGHTIHRLARDQGRLHAGQVLAVSSPQGRFADGAKELDGRTMTRAEALGKHLLFHWDDTLLVLHIHLGLFGRFRTHTADVPEPKGAVRLRLVGPNATTDLSGPTACELLDPVAMARIRARIGPDPLCAQPDDDADVQRFVQAMAKTRRAVGAVLLDQKVLAGVGNVYRAELLYRARVDPTTPCRDLRESTVRALWDDAVALLTVGVRVNRIVTVEPERSPGRRARGDRYYVYKQASCRTCSQDIAVGELGNRTLYWCASCQVERQ